jgi:cytochrome oxidase Cu insertion factor (SCO1/SenC/PrrC family)
MRRELYLVIPIAVLFLLSACTGSQPEELQIVATATPALEQAAESEVEAPGEIVIASEDTAGQQESEHEMEGEMADQAEEMAGDMAGDEAVGADRPAWQQLTLTNARTGETFTLADFGGQTVFVEPMATWCSNCRRQLTNVRDAQQQLADDDVVFVALSVETNIDDATLASYADGAGFDWLFAVVTPEMLEQLAGEFGRVIANPPATPHFIIRPDGTYTELVTGIEPTDQIISQITAAQS